MSDTFKRTLIILGILIGVSLGGWAIKNNSRKTLPPPVAKLTARKKGTDTIYNQALIKRLEAVFQRYNADGDRYTVSGTISVNDMADSSKRMNKVPFIMSRDGDDFYYRLGATQTLNAGGLYLYIDNLPKTILLGAQKTVRGNEGFRQAITGMSKSLLSEHYALVSTRRGREQTISMVNEHHITCKQYDVTIDTATMQLRKIFIRYTNFNDPSRKDNEKRITVKLNEWNNTGQPQKYLRAASVVLKKGSGYRPGPGYAQYELIKM